MQTNKTIDSGCHQIAHEIGHAAYVRYHDDAAQALAHGGMTCWSGYYHGVVERAFGGLPPSKVTAAARKLCLGPELRTSTFLLYQCVHGLGRSDDLQPERPAVLAACLRSPPDGLGPELVHRRSVHAELPPGPDADRADQVGE